MGPPRLFIQQLAERFEDYDDIPRKGTRILHRGSTERRTPMPKWFGSTGSTQ